MRHVFGAEGTQQQKGSSNVRVDLPYELLREPALRGAKSRGVSWQVTQPWQAFREVPCWVGRLGWNDLCVTQFLHYSYTRITSSP